MGSAARGDPAPPGRRRPARPLPSSPRFRPCEGEKRGELTGPSLVDRGKPGSKMHVLSDANGLPILVGVSAAHTHDSLALKPMITGHQTSHAPYRGRYFKPQRLLRRHGLQHPPPAKIVTWQAHWRSYRPQRHRVQRTARTPQVGDRADHVLADRLPPTQPPLPTPAPQLPGLSRPRRSPLLLQTTHPPHHIGHGLNTLGTLAGDHQHDPAPVQPAPVRIAVLPLVAEQGVGPAAKLTELPSNRRDAVGEGQNLDEVVVVAAVVITSRQVS